MEQEFTETLPPGFSTIGTHEEPDLSAEIAQTVQRQPGDRVRCRRVFKNTYRCNWHAPERSHAGDRAARFLETYRIRDSKFLRASRVDGALVIEDITVRASSKNN